MAPEVYEKVGHCEDALVASSVVQEQFPFLLVLQLRCRILIGRSLAQLGKANEAQQHFADVADLASHTTLYWLELMARRDAIEFGATGTGLGLEDGNNPSDHNHAVLLRQLGRPLSQFVLPSSEYDGVVGLPGYDLHDAVEAYSTFV